MGVFDSKNFNSEVFGKYLETVPRVKQNALLKAGVLRPRPELKAMLTEQTGGNFISIPMSGRIGGSVGGERRILLAHAGEEGVLVDFFLRGWHLDISEVIRFRLGSLVGPVGLDGRLAPLDQLDRFGLVNILSLWLAADSLPPDLLSLVFLEIDQEGLLLRRGIDVFQACESAGQQDHQMDSDRKDDPRHGGDFRLLLSLSKILFHHSGCVANITL